MSINMGIRIFSLAVLLAPSLILAGCGEAGQGPANGETTGARQTQPSTTGGSTSGMLTGTEETTSTQGTETTGIQTAAPTVAPDLESVGNLRPGPVDNNGSPRTYVDYTFNQKTYLTGSNRTSFALVPVGGGDSVYGSDFIPSQSVDEEGDNVVTVLFNGELNPVEFARGFTSDNSVSSDSQGNEPLNINQARPLKPDTASVNPELVSVRLDCRQNQVFFTFDEPLDQEDTVQNTGGLRVYFEDTKNAGAQAVDKTEDPAVLRAAFIDLPQGKTLGDAVGGYATTGTVAGQPPEGPGGQAINQLDEVHPVERGAGCR